MKVLPTEMEQVAAELTATINPLSDGAHVIALSGNLGAGKTTLAQYIAKQLGVTETVTSPTFVLMKQYQLTGRPFSQLVHIDAYRIETEDELLPLKFAELLENPQNIMLIEWPEHIAAKLPENRTNVTLAVTEDDARDITITYAKEN